MKGTYQSHGGTNGDEVRVDRLITKEPREGRFLRNTSAMNDLASLAGTRHICECMSDQA